MIYGVALLAACMFAGSFIGQTLGLLIGLNSDVGGVGFAMLFLLIITNSKKTVSLMPKGFEKGLEFWKEMFIPVVIAMSASQNVYSAFSGGWLALAVGLGAVIFPFVTILLLNKLLPEKVETEETEVSQ
ncbi:MAG: malonate transporter subunit MadL [Clostridia bacterium]|nr:malonate transporter subunit MadL [Clostridia bacterium]